MADLEKDIRKMMLPNTALNLRVRGVGCGEEGMGMGGRGRWVEISRVKKGELFSPQNGRVQNGASQHSAQFKDKARGLGRGGWGTAGKDGGETSSAM